MHRIAPFLLFAALLVGCVRPLPTPPTPSGGTDFFEALADDLPEQSDELVWVVQRLAKDGCLSTKDVDDFHEAFPGVNSTNRPLTEQDRTALRNLR